MRTSHMLGEFSIVGILEAAGLGRYLPSKAGVFLAMRLRSIKYSQMCISDKRVQRYL